MIKKLTAGIAILMMATLNNCSMIIVSQNYDADKLGINYVMADEIGKTIVYKS